MENPPRVWLQVTSILLVTSIVVAIELCLYLYAVVPAARKGLRTIMQPSTKPDAGDGDTVPARPFDVPLALAAEREAPLVTANNDACVLHGLLIAVVPLVLLVILFLSSRRLRAAPLGGTLIDVAMSVGMIAAFQLTFMFMGQQWSYPSMNFMIRTITDAYRTAATGSPQPMPARADDAIVGLWRTVPMA